MFDESLLLSCIAVRHYSSRRAVHASVALSALAVCTVEVNFVSVNFNQFGQVDHAVAGGRRAMAKVCT